MTEDDKIRLAMADTPEDAAFYQGVEKTPPDVERRLLTQEISRQRDPGARAILLRELQRQEGSAPEGTQVRVNAPIKTPVSDLSAFLDGKRGGSATAANNGSLEDFLNSRQPATPAAPPQSPMRRVGDAAIALGKGIIGWPEAAVGVADLATGGRVGKFLENEEGLIGFRPKQAREFLDLGKSEAQKAADAEVANAKGLIDTARAVVGNPSTAVMAAIESLPSIGGGGVAARGALAIAPRLGAVAAGALGEGVVSAGQNAEQVRQESPGGLLTGEQSGVLAASGALTSAIGLIGGKVAHALGINDINTLAAGGAGEVTKKGFIKRVLEGAFSEGVLEELPQSVQEQVAQNYAQGKPLDEGVNRAAVLGLFTGGLLGGSVAGIHGTRPPERPTPEKSMSDLDTAQDIDGVIAAAIDLADSYTSLTGAVTDYLTPGAMAAAAQVPAGRTALSGEGQRQALDSQARALGQAQTAGFEAERTAALEQAGVAQERAVGVPKESAAADYVDLTPMDLRQAKNRLLVLRDQAEGDPNQLVITPHPSQRGAFAIKTLPEPGTGMPADPAPLAQSPNSMQARIEAAALAGREAARRSEDAQRQDMITRTMEAINARGGVASPEEARLLREANMGRPYDRIDAGLSTTEPTLTTDQRLTRATGIQLTGQPRSTTTYGGREQDQAEAAAQREGQATYTVQPKQPVETQTGAPAEPPSFLSLADALMRAPFKRSATQKAVINAARQHYTAEQMETLQKAADNPASLSSEERIWIKGQAQSEQILSGVKLSTERAAPGGEVKVNHAGTAHSLRLEDPSKLRGYPLLREIARMAGHRVVAYSSETLKAGGFVANDGNTIYLNVNSQMNPLVEFGHEFGHLIEQNHPEIAAAMKEAVAANTDLDATLRDYTNTQEGESTPAESRPGEALSEGTSDLLGNRFSEPEFWTDVFSRVEAQHGAPKAKSIIQRLVAALNNALNKLLLSVTGSKFRADAFVKDINAVKSALANGTANYLAARRQAAVQTNAIDQAAHEAATSPMNSLAAPTAAQKEAGNYKKGHIFFQGLDITIENPRGSKREGVDPDGKAWSVEMEHHYGYIKGTVGKDKDHIDVFIGKSPASRMVYIVDQVNKDGGFDEHKVMLGFNSIAEAREGYADNYTKGWKVGPMTAVPMQDFKTWLESGDTTKPYSKGEIRGSKPTREASEPVTASTDRQGAEEVRRGPEPVSITGFHYSKGQRNTLTGSFYGSGLKGAEAKRLEETTDPRLKRRIYFYTDEGRGVIPEAGVGGFAHEASLDNLYDATTKKISAADLNDFESKVLDAGYDGYVSGIGNMLTGQRVAVVLGGATVKAKYIGNGPKAAVKQAPAPQGTGSSTALRNMFRNNPERAFKEPGWAILTATQEARGAADAEENVKANQDLEQDLRERGIAFEKVKGSYQGVDQGANYLIYANETVAKELGSEYGQESVLTNRGLVYSDGSGRLVPAVHKNDIVGEAARKEDFFSELPNGTAFSLGLNFEGESSASDQVDQQEGGQREHQAGDGRGKAAEASGGDRAERATPSGEETGQGSPREGVKRQSVDEFNAQFNEDTDAEFDLGDEGTRDNASGESAASLEAQSRVAQEKNKGQVRLLISRDGTVRPLFGVDSVDQRAGAGQVIVQRNVGRNAWTVLEEGDGVDKSMRARALDAAAKYDTGDSVDVESYSNKRDNVIDAEKVPYLVGLTKKQAQVSLIADLYSPFTLEERPKFKTVAEVAGYLEQRTLRALRGEPITESTNANRKFLSGIIAAEANAAFSKEGHAGQWYKQSITDAIATAAELHPEIATDSNQRFLFQFSLALTSNGQSVPENVKLAFEVYEGYKRDGKFPTWINGGGKNARAIVDSLAYAGDMIDNIRLDNFRQAMLTTWKARDLMEWSGRSVEAFLDDQVYGGSIFGPKIGGAFLQNLNGNFDALTIDRWMMRTWGRLTGRLVDPRAENGIIDTPGSAGRRAFIRDTMSEALDKMKESGNTIDMADLQAAIWYPEKELYALLGRNNAKAAPTDYATEVRKLVEARRRGDDGGASKRGGRDATASGLEEGAGVQAALFSNERQVDTPEFQRWFGDSKVVDADGKPLVVYHGTAQAFEAFDLTELGNATRNPSARLGFFFNSDPEEANVFAVKTDIGSLLSKEGANLIPVYLAIENPYEMSAGEFTDLTVRQITPPSAVKKLQRDLQAGGYDGVVVRADEEADIEELRGGDTWIAFKPEQIKSAIGNRGTFDPEIADVTASSNRDDLNKFHKRIVDQVKTQVEYGKMLARQHSWAFNVGDVFLSTKTGQTYTLVNRSFTRVGKPSDNNWEPVYYYENGNPPPLNATRAEQDVWPHDYQRGMFREKALLESTTMKNLTTPTMLSTQRIYGDLTPEQEASLKKVGAFPAEMTIRERLAGLKQDFGLRITQGLVDQFAALKRLGQKEYMLARLSKGSDGTMEAGLLYGKPFLRDGVPDVNVEDGGFAKSLAKLKGEQDRFMWWVAAQRAERLKAEGKEFLFDVGDISNLKSLSEGSFADGGARAPVYAEVLREMNDFNDALLKLAEESGLVDPEARKLFKDNPYVPFYRVLESGAAQGPKFSSGLVNQKAWKALKGSTKQLNSDLLSNMLLNWAHMYSASAKNRAAVASLKAATEVDIAYPVEAGTKGAVTVMEGGKAVHYKVEDPYILEAITALNYVTPEFLKPLSTFKRWLTVGVTASPAFKIRNLIRDSLSAIGQADLNGNVLANVAQGWAATRGGSQTLASMTAGGGMIHFGSSHEGDRSHRARKMIEKVGGKVLDAQGWKALTGQMEKLWDAYTELGDRGENVNRAALYEQLRAKGVSHAEANFMARDLMDFSMGGRWPAVRFLAETVPFMNARLQGLYKLGRAAKENPKRLGYVVGAVSMASLALMLGYKDDDDWKKREDWDRDSYWWFKIGDVAFRIPKPFEIGAIGTLAERTWEMGFDQEMTGKRYRERLSNMVFQTFAMDPTPQIVKPLLDVWANKDSFMQRPIEGPSLQNLRPEDRYDERTTVAAKWLGMLGLPDPAQLAKGQYTALSPKQLDFLIRGYFGSVGATATVALDWGLRPLTGAGERPDMKLRDVFLLGAFTETLPANSSRYLTQLYNNATAVEQAYASYQAAVKSGDLDKAREILGDEKAKIQLYPTVTALKRAEGELNARIKQVEASRTLSGETKRRLIDMLNGKKNELAERMPAQ